MTTPTLIESARAIVARWDSPNWSDAAHTRDYIDALRAAIDMISIDRQSFADCNARPDGSISDADGLILREYDDVLEKLRAALQAADRNAEMLEAARELLALKEELEHPQPPSAQAEPVAWRITDGEGGYDYRDDPPEDWQVAWVARWGRKHEPLYTQPHPQPPSAQNARPLSEWHEDDGPVVWWLFPVHEPAWIGTPLDTDWPGYHTHWTPHPAAPATLAETSR